MKLFSASVPPPAVSARTVSQARPTTFAVIGDGPPLTIEVCRHESCDYDGVHPAHEEDFAGPQRGRPMRGQEMYLTPEEKKRHRKELHALRQAKAKAAMAQNARLAMLRRA